MASSPVTVTVVPGSMVVVADPPNAPLGPQVRDPLMVVAPAPSRVPVRVPEEMELVMVVLDTVSVPERFSGRSASTAFIPTDEERLT